MHADAFGISLSSFLHAPLMLAKSAKPLANQFASFAASADGRALHSTRILLLSYDHGASLISFTE